MLHNRVIIKSQTEINEKTDLKIDHKIDRIGKKATSILFTMSLQKNGLLVMPDAGAITDQLSAVGLQDHQIEQVLKSHDLQYVQENFEIIQQRLSDGKQIDNLPAYLMAAFEKDYRPKETEHTVIQKKRAKAKKTIQEKKQKESSALVNLKQQFEEERKSEFELIKSELSESKLQELKGEFEVEISKKEFL